MDFDHGCKNSAGNLSPLFGNRFSYAPSPYPESLYNVRSGSNSLVNLPFCNTPVCSPLPKFSPICSPLPKFSPICSPLPKLSPECYTGNIASPNVRYLPYDPHFRPFIGADHRRSETRNIYPRNSPDCSITHEKRFDPPANNYQNVKMYQNVYKGKFDDKINFKSNPKRRKQNNLNGTPIMPKRLFPTHNFDINPHMTDDFNSLLNIVSNKEDLVNNKEIEYSNTHINEPNCAVAKQYSSAEVMSVNTDNTKIIIDNPSKTEEINFMTNGAENVTFNSGSQNAPVDNSFRGELEGIEKNSISGDTVINGVANEFGMNNSVDLTNCQVTHVTMPENSIFNVQDIQQENAGTVDLANYFFEPIFDGKDENGENIVILVGNTDTQAVDEVNIMDTSTSNANLETQGDTAILNSFTETSVETSTEISLDSHVPEINSEIDPNMFFSHMDDYGSAETVSTSKKKHLGTKPIKNRSNENTKEKPLININRNTEANGNFTSKPSTSSENKNNTNVTQNINPLNSKCNSKCKKFSFSRQIPHWRRRPLWKSNQPVIKMQRAYFRKFMKKVKYQNKHIVNEGFWNMYRIIVTRIGGNVLQTMYNILPELTRNSSVQKPNDCDSKQSKKHLQVKFQPKMKKKNNSENLGIIKN